MEPKRFHLVNCQNWDRQNWKVASDKLLFFLSRVPIRRTDQRLSPPQFEDSGLVCGEPGIELPDSDETSIYLSPQWEVNFPLGKTNVCTQTMCQNLLSIFKQRVRIHYLSVFLQPSLAPKSPKTEVLSYHELVIDSDATCIYWRLHCRLGCYVKIYPATPRAGSGTVLVCFG